MGTVSLLCHVSTGGRQQMAKSEAEIKMTKIGARQTKWNIMHFEVCFMQYAVGSVLCALWCEVVNGSVNLLTHR